MNVPNLPVTILRLPAVYGGGDRQHRFLPYLQRMVDQRPTILLETGQANWYWSHGYVENVAAAIALAITDDRATGRIYNLGEPATPTHLPRLQQLGQVIGWKGEIISVAKEKLPNHLQMNLQWRYHLAIDTSRIRDELGYVEPIATEEALQRTISWEQSNLADSTSTELIEQYRIEDEILAELS
ncbi:MAG: NAD-dependent epimerase/dehydratase family protein [Leptolyngbyaceae cyanobacterium CSU_1_3]|nr:NAD-dependent epimerase/dehydratase family protein [Leptolyngbyaceae cyanobacterium CSU_1_3]